MLFRDVPPIRFPYTTVLGLLGLLLLIMIVLTSAAVPSTRPMFAILLPKALPTARSLAPFKEAVTETSISGADVAKPTMVSPISMGDRPKLRAVSGEPLIFDPRLRDMIDAYNNPRKHSFGQIK